MQQGQTSVRPRSARRRIGWCAWAKLNTPPDRSNKSSSGGHLCDLDTTHACPQTYGTSQKDCLATSPSRKITLCTPGSVATSPSRKITLCTTGSVAPRHGSSGTLLAAEKGCEGRKKTTFPDTSMSPKSVVDAAGHFFEAAPARVNSNKAFVSRITTGVATSLDSALCQSRIQTGGVTQLTGTGVQFRPHTSAKLPTRSSSTPWNVTKNLRLNTCQIGRCSARQSMPLPSLSADEESARATWYALNSLLRMQENALCTQATGLPT